MSNARKGTLTRGVHFSLFATSYLPLFVLIILKQLFKNYDYLHFGGYSKAAFVIFLQKFGLSAILCLVILVGLFELLRFLREARRLTIGQGYDINILDVKNKNSEAISYVATYIIPFVSQDLSGIYELTSTLILLTVIFLIYINSTLIAINPILNLKYALYEIEFNYVGAPGISPSIKRNGLIIIPNKYLQEGDSVRIKKIGHKLYFGNLTTQGVEIDDGT